MKIFRPCCNRMSREINRKCPDEVHRDRTDCPSTVLHKGDDGLVGFLSKNEQGETRIVEINYCPWCGSVANR